MKNYKNKIVTNKKLQKILGEFPRKKGSKVAMCHGVFDLVHPGHIRHLQFAKTKSDILVVSITADLHVNKAAMRPYVPQQLRAENLAALECIAFKINRTANRSQTASRHILWHTTCWAGCWLENVTSPKHGSTNCPANGGSASTLAPGVHLGLCFARVEAIELPSTKCHLAKEIYMK